jgi:hypothetical protein
MLHRRAGVWSEAGRGVGLGALKYALVCVALGVAMLAACDDNPVDLLTASGAIQKTIPTGAVSQTKMDILWVVDNSGSMCQEQKLLADNFDKFISELGNARLDFHLGLTTTHVPQGAYPLEPVARAGHLQSRPQPLPSFDPDCRGDERNNFQQVRDALAQAIRCMERPTPEAFNWTNAELECGLLDTAAAACSFPDRNGDGLATLEDLFPLPSEYRQLPKFLR